MWRRKVQGVVGVGLWRCLHTTLTSHEIRQRFTKYFVDRQHVLVPTSALVPYGDNSLLFTNAGMVQFKDIFLGHKLAPYTAAVSVQRCMRAGGKHNDLDNVGYTPRHHTYFEMLGNFSFGQYFKQEAITLAWDFLVNELRLPPERLRVTILEGDAEAFDIWNKVVGLSAEKIVSCGTSDNFWSMGDGEGPCGPCSEIYWDLGEEATSDRWLEIWNLVFMQNHRQADGTLQKLSIPCVDTGMGLERIAAVLQGKNNNYEIDTFATLTSAIINLLRKTGVDTTNISASTPQVRIIADHVRACCFLIADRVLPGNTGRSYVLRRILRRAVNAGHQLGFRDPFMSELIPALLSTLSLDDLQHIQSRRELISILLNKEEIMFAANLGQGLKLLEAAAIEKHVSAALAFSLHDSHGFPLDLTGLISQQKQWTVDIEGAERLLEQQRNRGRASWTTKNGKDWISKATSGWGNFESQFVGYDLPSTPMVPARILQLAIGRPSDKSTLQAVLLLDESPFYPRGGGQEPDAGHIEGPDGKLWQVEDVLRISEKGIAVVVTSEEKNTSTSEEEIIASLSAGSIVLCKLNQERRVGSQIHHTATHLLHAALRHTLGSHVTQAGSYVDDQRLRFDFTHTAPLTPQQLIDTETFINKAISDQIDLIIKHDQLESALKRGAMAMFNEKYGNIVRTVEIPGFSLELCGGMHVKNTEKLFPVKIISESAIAAGVRRIEAVGGKVAVEWLSSQHELLQQASNVLQVKPRDLPKTVANLKEDRKDTRLKLVLATQLLAAMPKLGEVIEIAATIPVAIHFLPSTLDASFVGQRGDELRQQQPNTAHVLVLGHVIGCVIEPSVFPNYHAGKVIEQLVSDLGGRGGGSSEWGQGKLQKSILMDDHLIATVKKAFELS